jgi:hypothetical protein
MSKCGFGSIIGSGVFVLCRSCCLGAGGAGGADFGVEDAGPVGGGLLRLLSLLVRLCASFWGGYGSRRGGSRREVYADGPCLFCLDGPVGGIVENLMTIWVIGG